MKEPRRYCHDCGIEEGGLHSRGCDMERCPFCGGQLITCNCCYEKLCILCELGTEVYEHGLSEEDSIRWSEMLEQKGRVPYILYPNLCCRCGKRWPEMFDVSDADWARYVEPAERSSMLCHECYEQIKEWIMETRI